MVKLVTRNAKTFLWRNVIDIIQMTRHPVSDSKYQMSKIDECHNLLVNRWGGIWKSQLELPSVEMNAAVSPGGKECGVKGTKTLILSQFKNLSQSKFLGSRSQRSLQPWPSSLENVVAGFRNIKPRLSKLHNTRIFLLLIFLKLLRTSTLNPYKF